MESRCSSKDGKFDDTYLDIIAVAKIDISQNVDSAVRKNI